MATKKPDAEPVTFIGYVMEDDGQLVERLFKTQEEADAVSKETRRRFRARRH